MAVYCHGAKLAHTGSNVDDETEPPKCSLKFEYVANTKHAAHFLDKISEKGSEAASSFRVVVVLDSSSTCRG